MADAPSGYPFRKFAIIGILTLTILIGGLGGWSATAQLSGAVIAPGAIELEQNRQVVQHPYGGIVEEILVREGELVEQDDLLIRLDSNELLAELQIIEGQLAELLARSGRYVAERDDAEAISFPVLLDELQTATERLVLTDGQTRLFAARQENLRTREDRFNERIGQIESQIEGIDAQMVAIDEQLSLINEELEGQRTLLDQGLTQASRVGSLEREAARLRGRVGELTAQKSQARGMITEQQIQTLNLYTERREEAITFLRDLGVRQLELQERRNVLLQRLSRLEIRAPVPGLVYNQAVFAQKAVIRSADPLMYIIPQGQPLVILSQVRPSDIDQVHLDQTVSVRFSSFSQRTTPMLIGNVRNISGDTFVEERTGAPFFRVEVHLQVGEIEKLPEGSTILPGMQVETFIETDSRTPFEYIVKPITDYVGRAFRES